MDFLFSSISDLKLNKYFTDRLKILVGGTRIIDLLFFFPRHFLVRERVQEIKDEHIGKNLVLRLKIVEHIPSFKGRYGKKSPYQIITRTERGEVVIISYFNYKTPQYLKKLFPVNAEKLVSGKVQRFNNDFEISHPEYVVDITESYKIPVFEPIYPLTAGIQNQFLIKLIRGLFAKIPEVREWLQNPGGYPSWRQAVIDCHTKPDHENARKRLALDEVVSIRQALSDLRQTYGGGKIIALQDFDTEKLAKDAGFPFDLTNDQKNAISDIISDLRSDKKMSRLLQGDVGSGKTMVAFETAVYAVLAGHNVALLAPTEMLAKQHMEVFQSLLSALNQNRSLGITAELLISKTKAKAKLYERLAAGEVNVLIGTHALIEEKVQIGNLGYVIIDEQHKFGVQQRNRLKEKDPMANVLYMSATPIPRTLMMVLNRDMEISYIKEKPKNRIPVETFVMPISKMSDLIFRLKELLIGDNRAFWVCPAIEMSEVMPITSVEERFDYVKTFFGADVDVVHGKMKEAERNAVVERFKSGEIKLLLSTTVIEVGIDVPDANVIVIENAERFGLAQLHQLRGRVGRGGKKSYCILLYGAKLTADGEKRLMVMKETLDGFVIAEKDLEIRGYGDYVGKRQTGLPLFRVADPFEDADLFAMADRVQINDNKENLFKIYQREI